MYCVRTKYSDYLCNVLKLQMIIGHYRMCCFLRKKVNKRSGKEHATTSYSCHGVFTDRSIFTSNLTRIQTPAGTSVTNHRHGLNFMYLVFYFSLITQVIIEILALSLAKNVVIFRYNHLRRGDYSGRTNFQMAASRFVDVSEEEINL